LLQSNGRKACAIPFWIDDGSVEPSTDLSAYMGAVFSVAANGRSDGPHRSMTGEG
jgi:hypothetical protein